MFKHRVIAAMAAAVTIGGAAVAVTSAHAQGAEVANCTFTGDSGQLSAPIDPVPRTFQPGGSYDFTGTADCVGAGTAVTGAGINGTIDSPGTYTNIVCGTGTATGSFTMSGTNLVDGSTITVTGNYTINFVAGVGALTGSGTVNGQPVNLAGPVDIIPDQPGGCVTAQVQSFTVAGNTSAVGASA